MVISRKNTLRKSERLSHKKDIERLFTSGAKSILAFPVRSVYMPFSAEPDCGQEDGHAVLISVSKRYFRHSVDRNRVKRQIREAYRTHKYILEGLPSDIKRLYIAFLWSDGRLRSSAEVTAKVKNLLTRIVEAFNKKTENENPKVTLENNK